MRENVSAKILAAAIGLFACAQSVSAQWTSNSGHAILTDVTKGVGIGISTASTPLGKLQVLDGSVLFNGSTGSTPTSGAGVRLMWIPAKGAFRAGEVNSTNSTHWDDANIGANSFAAGYSVKASGARSVALGGFSIVSGISAIGIGHSNTVSSDYGAGIGYQNTVSGGNGVALGTLNSVTADYGTAIGESNTASGINSTALGYLTTSSGTYSTSMGNSTSASGDASTALGQNTSSQAFASFVSGRYNVTSAGYSTTTWVSGDPLFVIGNGSSSVSRSNAVTVLKDGKVGIGTSAPAHLLELNADDAVKPSSTVWTLPSDARLKKNIEPFTDGLDVIRQINPVRYQYNGLAGTPTGDHCIGIIAQEMQKIAPYTIRPYRARLHPEDANETEILAYNHNGVMFAEINAIKQLDAQGTQLAEMNQQLTARNQALREQLEAQSARIAALEQALNGSGSVMSASGDASDQQSAAQLNQNEPNPFSDNTTITYRLPNSTTHAYLAIYEAASGKQVRTIELAQRDRGEVVVSATTLAAGTYFYAMVADNVMIAGKRMIIVK